MSAEIVDQDQVQILRESAAIVGYLYEIVVNADNSADVLAGKHRDAADKNWTHREMKVDSPLHRELVIVAFNAHRQIPEEQTANRLLRIARMLSTTGGIVRGRQIGPVKKEDVCSAMSGEYSGIPKLVPFTPQHIRRCLPAEYKHVEHAVRHKTESDASQNATPEIEPNLTKKEQELLEPFTQNLGASPEMIVRTGQPETVVTYPTDGCLCPQCLKGHPVCYGCPAPKTTE